MEDIFRHFGPGRASCGSFAQVATRLRRGRGGVTT
jgi:hypothetical protein